MANFRLAAVVSALIFALCVTAQTTKYVTLNITVGEPLPVIPLFEGNTINLDMLPAHIVVRARPHEAHVSRVDTSRKIVRDHSGPRRQYLHRLDYALRGVHRQDIQRAHHCRRCSCPPRSARARRVSSTPVVALAVTVIIHLTRLMLMYLHGVCRRNPVCSGVQQPDRLCGDS